MSRTRNSGIIGAKNLPTTSNASGVHDTFDQYVAKKDNSWPRTKKVEYVTGSFANHYEGEVRYFTVKVDGFDTGDTVYWTLSPGSLGYGNSNFESFSGLWSNPANSTYNFFIRPWYDTNVEGSHSYHFQIRHTSVTGPILYESPEITIPDATYYLTPNISTVDEGSSVTFTMTGSNVYNGTYYWTVDGTAGNTTDLNLSNNWGNFTYNGTSGSFTIGVRSDNLTEGAESFNVRLRGSSTVGTILVTNVININDTSVSPTATITPSQTSIGEGFGVTFTVATTGIANGTTIAYDTIFSADAEVADINPSSGTVTINNNTGSISITAVADSYTETGQTESFQVRVYDPNNNLMATSAAVTINDLSTGTPEPSGIDITTSFYEISNRFLNSQTYMGNSYDYNGPYDVGEVQTDFTGTGRVYIGVKVTSTTTYYNDVPIAGVQIVSGGTLVASWIFNTTSGGSGSGWASINQQLAGSQNTGFPVTPATASTYGYSNMTTGSGTGKFSYASSTGSSYTGAADGIGNTYKLSADGGSNTLATVGNGQVSQTSNTYYAYRETSGASLWSGTVMRSPTYTFSGGEYIRVIHALTGPTNSQMDPNDTLYVAVY